MIPLSRRLLAALALLLYAGPLHAETVRVEAYRQAVSGCLSRASDPFPLSAAPCRRLIESEGAVYADGQTVTVDNAALERDLRAAPRSPEARRAARERLKTLSAILNVKPGDNADDPRAQAQAILQREEFRPPAELPRGDTWWDRLLERIARAIARFLERIFGNAPSVRPGDGRLLGTSLLYILAGIAVAAALVAVVTLINGRTMRRRRARAAQLLADLEEGAGDDPLAAARRHADDGDYRSALRLTYLACLRRLFNAGLLVPQEDHTNWEYQRELRARSQEAHDTLLTVTRDFDRIWYGEMTATRAEYERALAAYDALPAPVVAGAGSGAGNARKDTQP